MFRSLTRMSIVLAALVLSVNFGRAQETKDKGIPITPTTADSGEQMFKDYCAVCHGRTGKGDGPAVAALKTPPPDLTMLTKNNGGKFPADRVRSVLRMGMVKPAHGTKEMPIWGPKLNPTGLEGLAAGVAKLRIENLTDYVESIQTK